MQHGFRIRTYLDTDWPHFQTFILRPDPFPQDWILDDFLSVETFA
jgi:hypothetical protein